MTMSCPRVVALPSLSLLALGLLTALNAQAQTAAADADAAATQESSVQASNLDKVMVIGQRASRVSNGATNLDLDVKETPQSISVITREQMTQFGADSLNDALSMATGIQVERVSTNQTNFLSRGFEIKNTQIDGVGLPNGWGVVTNAMDAYGFEKLEVIRGANGLLTGVGNAAGTINYVRKRPTNERQGQFGVTVGTDNRRRVEADYSTPFTAEGTWAGRVVAAYEEADSYLRGFESDRNYFYGVVDGQIGENGTLAVGYSRQKANTSGNMWGALTFNTTDGSQLEWDRSANAGQDWSYWNSTTEAGFVDYIHQISDRWQFKASYNYNKYDHDSVLLMAFSYLGLDPVTHTGLTGWAYKSPYETTAHLGDISLSGRFDLWGREHEAMFGASTGESKGYDWYHPADFSSPAFGPLPAFPYPGNAIPEPVWGARTIYTTLNQRLSRVFGATRLALTDRFKAILGFNWAEYHRDGMDNTKTSFSQTESNFAPYVGVTFDFTENLLAYANYSYIFQPQEQLDYDRNYIDPSKGVNYEIGIKGEWLNQRLLTTLAFFSAKQDGLATAGGTRFMDGYAFGYYVGEDIESKGFEFEAVGRLNDYTEVLFGYTNLRMDGNQGSSTYAWVPRRSANLSLSSKLPSFTALSFGVGGRWQGDVAGEDGFTHFIVRQDSYTLLNAFASWDITPSLTLRANVNNITDKKYIYSLYNPSYYGAPREYALNLNWRF